MKKFIIIGMLFLSFIGYSQTTNTDEKVYKKRVLESAEVDIITSYYSQNGDNASVTGGIGTEELTDFATDISVSIPLNDDAVFAIDVTVSAYSSASSSNLNPFDTGDDDDNNFTNSIAVGSPWVESSGASKSDVWVSGNLSYSHSSDDRNTVLGTNLSFAKEYDYTSFGVGGNFTRLFNQKNTEFSLKANAYFDTWSPLYPKEIKTYVDGGQSINSGFFNAVDILDQNGSVIDKNGTDVWSPINTTLVDSKNRNTYSLSLSFSQILSKKAQGSIFLDIIQQNGWLANPMQRVYFGDKPNYYIGNPTSIPNYTSPTNTDVFQLADDIERLPDTRFKIPIGARFNYYINEYVTLRTYYRYYYDDWGITSQTAEIELPIKISDKFTLNPSYRFYKQTAADYFAPYEEHSSTSEFYTSDYDLSEFNSNQFGFGISYKDIFTKFHIRNFGLKSIDLKYSSYKRNTGLKAGIISAGFKFVMD
ncbi:MAG: DUF3570 domain-containing protein [Lutibacter sp.]|nr:DUF3570 domain-containing protein [Lutibacter sp.]